MEQVEIRLPKPLLDRVEFEAVAELGNRKFQVLNRKYSIDNFGKQGGK